MTSEGVVPTRPPLRALVVSMRPRQWVKNLLVLAAPAAAGTLTDPATLGAVALAFVAMTAASAATYLANDVRDRVADANHSTKRHRPVAAGEVAAPVAATTAAVLAVVALGLPFVLGIPGLSVVVLAYLAMTTGYSLGLKRVRLLELFLVASGFVLRAIAGAVATGVAVSNWFLIVVSAGAVYLVAAKRFAEQRDQTGGVSRSVLQDYPRDMLAEVRYASVAVALLGYLLWSFEMRPPGVPWHPLSAIPFALAVFEYAAAVHEGHGEAPEDVILGSRRILAYGAVWAVLFALGTYGGA